MPNPQSQPKKIINSRFGIQKKRLRFVEKAILCNKKVKKVKKARTPPKRRGEQAFYDRIKLLLLFHCRVARAAIYRSVLAGLERNFCFTAAFSACRCEEFSCGTSCILSGIAAALASLGLVLEASFSVEFLFTC